jgi:very-short-patch-repair endonuclease
MSTPERFGVFTTAEARARGVSPRQGRTLIRRGDVIRIRRGCYITREDFESVAADPSGVARIEAMAAVLATERYAAASFETAAAIHAVGLLGPPPSVVHLTRERTVSSGVAGRDSGILLHCASLPASHVWMVGELPVTSVGRALIDIARHRDPQESLVAMDSALHSGKVTESALWSVLSDCQTWPGAKKAEWILRIADANAESPFESLSRLLFHDRHVVQPETQAVISDDRGYVGRVDFLWRDARVIGEADGMVKYTEPGVLRAEKVRQERLEQTGHRVVRWLWRELRDAPEVILMRLRTAGVPFK